LRRDGWVFGGVGLVVCACEVAFGVSARFLGVKGKFLRLWEFTKGVGNEVVDMGFSGDGNGGRDGGEYIRRGGRGDRSENGRDYEGIIYWICGGRGKAGGV
jgi:hypothetical protein